MEQTPFRPEPVRLEARMPPLYLPRSGMHAPPGTTVPAFLCSAVLMGLEFMDPPMSRRRLSFRRRLSCGVRHVWTVMGFGTLMSLAMLVPLVGPGAPYLSGSTISGRMTSQPISSSTLRRRASISSSSYEPTTEPPEPQNLHDAPVLRARAIMSRFSSLML